jgi:hypothetical protein
VTARLLVGAAVLGGLGLGCSDRSAGTKAGGGRAEAAVVGDRAGAPPTADSLVATAPRGEEIWFTLARPDSADGRQCLDRAIEIRRNGARVPVPLLYTGTSPEILNDTTLRARLSNDCRPGDAYLVDLRTGRPVRERP